MPSVSSRPKLIVACRLSAGIAVPVYALRSALSTTGAFPDGMMTTNPDSLGPEYRLPLSGLGKAAEGNHRFLLNTTRLNSGTYVVAFNGMSFHFVVS